MSLSTSLSHFFSSWLRLFISGFVLILLLFTSFLYLEMQHVRSQLISEFNYSAQKLRDRTYFISGFLSQRLFLLENSAAMQRVVNDPSELATVGLLSEWSKFSRGFDFRNRIYYVDMSGKVILKLNHENEQPVVTWGGKRTTALTQHFKSIKWAAPGQMYMHKLGAGENAKYLLYLAVFDKWATLNGFIVQEFNQKELNGLVQELSTSHNGEFLTIFQHGDWNSYSLKSEQTIEHLQLLLTESSVSNSLSYQNLSDWEYHQPKVGSEVIDGKLGLMLMTSVPGFLNSKPIILAEYISYTAIFGAMQDWLAFWLLTQLFAYIALAAIVTLWSKHRDIQKKMFKEEAIRNAAFEGSFSQLVADAEGKIVAVNSFHCQLLGMRKADLLGLNADAFMLNMEPSYAEISQLAIEYSGWHGELSWQNSKGETHYTLANIALVVDEDGSLQRLVFSGVDLSEKKSLEKQLQSLADTDPLTGCYNRRAFESGLAREYSRSLRSKHPFALLLIDVDHFKVINANYGHDMGDRVLVDLVKEVKLHIRTSDLLSRWGGEEFVLLLPDTTGSQAMVLAERLRQAFVKSEVHPNYTASIGVCEGGADLQLSSEAIFKAANAALRQAKYQGRNCVVLADAQTQVSS